MSVPPSIDRLQTWYTDWSQEPILTWKALTASGSERRYYRAESETKRALVVHNPNEAENQSYVQYTQHFIEKGLPVPELYAEHLAEQGYLVEDLGTKTLLEHLEEHRTGAIPHETTLAYYRKAVAALARLQVEGIDGLDVEAYQRPAHFDRTNMLWDLNYFKYCYLKAVEIPFDEWALEQDFQQLVEDLSEVPTTYFMMRDCQARNIMVQAGTVYFIDYQGGKYGPLAYDVASLLYQAKANLPQAVREALLDDYLVALSGLVEVDPASFKRHFYRFVLLRSLQVLGAYGYRGLSQGKAHFLESIPYALNNLAWLLDEGLASSNYPYLRQLLRKLIHAYHDTLTLPKPAVVPNRLTLTIQSFSYKQGYPKDDSSNGGGFVFDCRFLHNPGRYQPYKRLTGRDTSVQAFLLKESTISEFLAEVKAIVSPAIDNYLERKFQHLGISFGCTGGQHRSVYSADQLAAFVEEHYPQVRVRLWHREQERKGWIN